MAIIMISRFMKYHPKLNINIQHDISPIGKNAPTEELILF